MKKISCFSVLLFFCIASAYSQTYKFDGKYKGKDIKITVTRVNRLGDRVDYLYYEGLEQLEKEVRTLKKSKAECEERISRLQSENATLKKNGNREAEVAKNALVDSLQRRIGAMNISIAQKEQEKDSIEREMIRLQELFDDMISMNESCEDSISSLLAKVEILQAKLVGQSVNRNSINFNVGFGMGRLNNAVIGEAPWNTHWESNSRFELSYSHYFSRKLPYAIRAGVAFSSLVGSATLEMLQDTIRGLTDVDGDLYDARYAYSDVRESVRLNYIDIPLLLHIGNSYEGMGIHGWAEAGIRFSFLVSSSFEGQGLHTVRGFYPAWNLEVSDVEELGFVSNKPVYSDKSIEGHQGFMAWGELACGVFVPVGRKMSINLGVRGAYSLLPVAKGDDVISGVHYNAGHINICEDGETRALKIGVEIGVSYHF